MAVFQNKIVKQILEKYQTLWALTHYQTLGGWDLNTYMPEAGASARGLAEAKLSVLRQKLFLNKEFVSLIKALENEANLNDYEKAVLRVLRKALDHYEKLPPEFLEEWSKVTNEAHIIWKNAKKNNDFVSFAPSLEKIVQLCQRKAEYLGYPKHPYDALLDDYEEGWKTSEVEEYFNSLRQSLKELLSKIMTCPRYLSEHPLEKEPYLEQEMRQLNQKILKFLNYDPKTLRLDISVHPFTETISLKDVRITTWYHQQDFARSLMATVHEFGHALYELQCLEELEHTPVAGGVSLGVHESQSRFWENLIARTPEFISLFYQDFIGLGQNLAQYSEKEIAQYFNLVRPSLIRVEADELTYHFHIMLRFEIEKALIENKLKVKDLPEVWEVKFKEYLGIAPKTDTEGVLQDIHWSMGALGYFPTYSLGTSLSAVWKSLLERELGSLNQLIGSVDGVSKIQFWLRQNLHQYGSTYVLKDLLRQQTGKEELRIQPLLDYLTEKYSAIYQI
ncbi:MAG: carboxypeptidase M32 [Patescibacteria group bacterium]